jgi:hypothetical protein
MWGRRSEKHWFVTAAVFGTLGFGTHLLHAQDMPVAWDSQAHNVGSGGVQHADGERPPGVASPSPPRDDYAGWLIGSYLSVPLLSLGLPVFVNQFSDDDTLRGAVLVVGIAGAVAMPMTVHLLHDEGGLALRAALVTPTLVVTGLLAGAWIGSAATSDAALQDDEDAAFSNAITGALIGGSIALVGWAVFDLIDSGARRGTRRRSARAGLRVAVLPYPDGVVACAALRL